MSVYAGGGESDRMRRKIGVQNKDFPRVKPRARVAGAHRQPTDSANIHEAQNTWEKEARESELSRSKKHLIATQAKVAVRPNSRIG